MRNPITKNWAGGVAQEGPEFKPQYQKKIITFLSLLRIVVYIPISIAEHT
jgi:hypothetical protein